MRWVNAAPEVSLQTLTVAAQPFWRSMASTGHRFAPSDCRSAVGSNQWGIPNFK